MVELKIYTNLVSCDGFPDVTNSPWESPNIKWYMLYKQVTSLVHPVQRDLVVRNVDIILWHIVWKQFNA